MIAVMQAYENGSEIECNYKNNDKWFEVYTPIWDWDNHNYRVKQPPKKKLWYWEFKYKGVREDWWELHDVRLTEEEAQEKSALDHRKLEALGFIEE